MINAGNSYMNIFYQKFKNQTFIMIVSVPVGCNRFAEPFAATRAKAHNAKSHPLLVDRVSGVILTKSKITPRLPCQKARN